MSELWYVWLILGVIFVLAEVFTSGFVLLWFGVGAFVAAILAFTGIAGLPAQVIVFLIVATALTIGSRTIFERVLMRNSPGRQVKTGVDALPGQLGIVVAAPAGSGREGAVRVSGSTWRAFPAEGEDDFKEGEQVRVERVEGASIYVRRIDSVPSWRRIEESGERP